MDEKYDDAMELLIAVMNDASISMADRIAAAEALMPYQHERLASEDEEDDY